MWGALGRQVAGRNYPLTNKNTLICALTEKWDKRSQQLLDNVVQSIYDVECCMTYGHIPVVQRLGDQYQSEDSVSRRSFQADHELQMTTPAEDRFQLFRYRRRRTTTVPQLVADHFKHQKKNLRYCGVKSSSQCKTSPDLQWRVIQASTDLEEMNSALDTINPTLLKDTVIEVVESWPGQGSRSVATLTCMFPWRNRNWS
ncbi:hypothetical protein TNCV_3374161 [Trichonephila clavipes]|nr:hypothetical protein TNCV_3374161 [Trichonephila clavipes]